MANDFSELDGLVQEIASAPAAAGPLIEKALEVTSRSIKDDWRQGATISRGYAKTYAAAISYDIKGYAGFGGAEIYSEIGPVLHTTPGASAGFLEDAGGGVDGPAHHAGREALEANEDDFHRGLEIALYDATKRAVRAS